MEKEKKSFFQRLKGLSSKSKIISVGVIATTIVAIIIITAIVNNIQENRRKAIEESNKRTVPNLVGMTYKDAKEEIEKLELTVYTYRESPNDDDIVTTQNPSAETIVMKGTKINVTLTEQLVEKANTYTGMQFKVSKEEYERQYLSNYTNEINYNFADKSFEYGGTDELTDTFSKYIHALYYSPGLHYNSPRKEYFYNTFEVDNNTNKVVLVQCLIDYYNISNELNSTAIADMLRAMTPLNNGNVDKIKNIFEEMINNNETNRFKDGILYSIGEINIEGSSKNWMSYRVIAITEEKSKELINGNLAQTSSSTEQQTATEDIQQTIDALNKQYGYNFQADDYEMEQIMEFYNISNYTGNFNIETLRSFLNQRGWIDTTQANNNSSSAQQSSSNNSSSSNKSSSTSPNTNTNSSKYETVTATLNINLKQLIAKNSTAQEIKEKYPTIFIHVYVEDALVDNDTFEYYNGGSSIPDTITSTTTISQYSSDKKPTEKRTVRITMDNTSTAIVETTLFEGEMIFDKTGTYEIK